MSTILSIRLDLSNEKNDEQAVLNDELNMMKEELRKCNLVACQAIYIFFSYDVK